MPNPYPPGKPDLTEIINRTQPKNLAEMDDMALRRVGHDISGLLGRMSQNQEWDASDLQKLTQALGNLAAAVLAYYRARGSRSYAEGDTSKSDWKYEAEALYWRARSGSADAKEAAAKLKALYRQRTGLK